MISWLLAFVLHSTLWLGLAWLVTRLRPQMQAGLRETIWYTAILASLITPTVQTLYADGASLWSLPLPAEFLLSGEGVEGLAIAAGEEHSQVLGEEHASAFLIEGWQAVAPWAWAGISLALLLAYLGQLEALRRRLGRRERVDEPKALDALAMLSSRAGLPRAPRLTESENLGSPVALGFGWRREICIPTRALHELDREHFTALLGHELAHHLRRDTLRLGILNCLQSIFFFQPLFRVANRAVHFAAEEICDDWAAQQVEDRLVMASCLTEVAAWVLPRDRRLPVPCMARRTSQLRVRVQRLMEDGELPIAPRKTWQRLASIGLLSLAPWITPSLATAVDMSDPSELGAIEDQIDYLESEFNLLLDELGSESESSAYRVQTNQIKAQIRRLRRIHELLNSLSITSPDNRREAK